VEDVFMGLIHPDPDVPPYPGEVPQIFSHELNDQEFTPDKQKCLRKKVLREVDDVLK
jgi:hypothetical protein